MNKYILLFLLVIPSICYADPRLRPETWGEQIIGTQLENLYLVDSGVYRSEQPYKEDINNLRLLGIKEVLNLREHHSDKDDITDINFKLHRIKIDTGNISEEQIITAVQIIKNRKALF